MLAQFARYLRAAGYDTALGENGAPDAVLLGLAAREARWFLTLDRDICLRNREERVVLLTSGSVDHHAAVLMQRFPMDWLTNSFTRCLVDNTPLEPISDHSARIQAMHEVPDHEQRYLACPSCRRVYWRGSHYHRMRERLAGWQCLQSAAAAPAFAS